MQDFIAIDFETANECPSSICSIGAVLVRNGEIARSFYSLIRPEPEYYKWFCQQVHGITQEDTEDAPYSRMYGTGWCTLFSESRESEMRN